MPEPAATTPAPRPWRKRHPVIARTLLYGLGLGLAAVLLVLFTKRERDDERTRIAALQQELDGLSLVLAADPSGDAVLQKLDETFSDPALPLITRGRVLRWRAMAWRARANSAADTAARDTAIEQAERALTTCEALELDPEERTALHLEWAEARLERRDVKGALAVMPTTDDLRTVPAALLATLLRAQALRLDGRGDDSVTLVRTTLMGLDVLDPEHQAHVGGRAWTAAQVAVELANYATTVGAPAAARAAWNRLRALAKQDFGVQIGAARGLFRGGAHADARSAWTAAKAVDGPLAASEAKGDPVLQALDQTLRER